MKLLIGTMLLLPLIGFLINFLFGKNLPKTLVGMIGSATILGSFLVALNLYLSNTGGTMNASVYNFMEWIHVGDVKIDFAFLFDPLSIMMLMIITGIGFLIHVYSIGYMHDDEGFFRFFAYLNLFIFFMQFLVAGSNYLITFIGWEGVGLCSYLLIGFWFKNQEYNNAAKKAFIMNRVGDLGFLLGLFWILSSLGTLNYTEVGAAATSKFNAGTLTQATLVGITILLFIGATGKSAQIPLYTWLPDAMAGPTPVSALIHAATMVTAGIFLIVRSHVLFHLAPLTMDIILIIGMATSIFAASIGLVQNDIKKVLAYSTVSQLGLMFVALGLGAYTTAMFHLTTHAFFKALLFLGAGSVIHAMSGEQDIRMMGGLRKKLPITFIVFLIGTVAITGIPPFAGFFSKDEILAKAFERSPVIWALGLFSSLLTAVYMFRLFYLTFFGSFRGTEEQRHHLHESPAVMTTPLIVLAVLSTIGGFMGVPEIFHMPHALNNFLAPVLADIHTGHEAHHASATLEIILMAVSAGMAILVMIIASRRYSRTTAEGMEDEKITGFSKVLANKYYVDELYEAIFVKPADKLSVVLHRVVDNAFIDGIVNAAGRFVHWTGSYLRYVQTGNIGSYIFAMVLAIVLFLAANAWLSTPKTNATQTKQHSTEWKH